MTPRYSGSGLGGSLPIKVLLKQLALKGYTATGRYKPFGSGDLQQIQSDTVKFSGDIPRGAGSEKSQVKLAYRLPRVPQEIHNLLYTPKGMAWKEGALHQRYSLQEPALRDLYERPSEKPTVILPEGTVVQAETPYTYGDWVSEHLCTLISSMPVTAPLLMPRHLMAKSYVRRDLGLLGIKTYTVECTLLVKKALVLPKSASATISLAKRCRLSDGHFMSIARRHVQARYFTFHARVSVEKLSNVIIRAKRSAPL